MEAQLTESQTDALRIVCDTVVPRIDHRPDLHGLWARSARDLGVDVAAAEMICGLPLAPQEGVRQLLDALAQQQLRGKSQASREQALKNVALVGGAQAAAGIGALIGMVLFLTYGLPDPSTGRNVMWDAFGYTGPLSPPPADAPRPITPTVPDGDQLTLAADVVVVGSGAGGGVIAGTLAQRGRRVVVLESGPYLTESDFLQLELPAYQRSYWRGGPQASADLNITLLAGNTLGGGTTVNWTNSLRTRAWVREEWAAAGMEDIATDFDRHLDAVWERIGVNGECSDLNGTQELMKRGADALGWRSSVATRNVDPDRYDPATGGFIGFGDQSGAKQGTLKTYLQDAFDAGAVLVPDTFVHRVLIEDGQATGAEGTWTDARGRTAAVIVNAPRVVVAAGALESPALLLRSGIGGAHVGRHLRLHPTIASSGVYAEDTRAYWGAPHALLVDEFESGADAEGFGFRIEGTQYAPGLIGSATPWTSAADHKALMEMTPKQGVFLGRIRDHGEGTVTLDDDGQAQVHYALTDPIDIATVHRAIAALTQLHIAAGATQMSFLARNAPTWRRGDDANAFIARSRRIPLRAGGMALFTAHEMGSCRMGADPAENVADARGELHDTRGVWIGDASAFPTASGTNPMISIMALAHRTAEAIAHTA